MKPRIPRMTKTSPDLTFVHPAIPGVVVTRRARHDAWIYLDQVLGERDIMRAWPTEGWRLTMDGLRCEHCGETNVPGKKPMVEQDRDGTTFCAACGRSCKPASTVRPVTSPRP